MPIKKIPERKCLGCMEKKQKKELVRIVRNKEGEISMDLTGKKAGRGAYVCPSLNCLLKLKKSKRLERNFSCTISDEIYNSLEQEISLEK